MWAWHDGPGGWGWFWMALMMALFWVPLLLALVWVVRQWTPADGARLRSSDQPDATEIARRAYARGELGRERFLEIIADLEREDGRTEPDRPPA